jgi:hypothetical protein
MGFLDRIFNQPPAASPSSAFLIPVPSPDGVHRGDFVTRTVVEWLVAELPRDGTAPTNWPLSIGPLIIGSQADVGVRALVAVQNLFGSLGEPFRSSSGLKKQLIELWGLSEEGTIRALLTQRPATTASCYHLWIVQNRSRGLTLLFAGEFKSLPADYHVS